MTAATPYSGRWCDQHDRHECGSLRRFSAEFCHRPVKQGTTLCGHHEKDGAATMPAAHQAVSIAVAEGRLDRPLACQMCGCMPHPRTRWDGTTYYPLNAHHEDYARPLDVIWLCTGCHRRVHGPGLAVYVTELRAYLAIAERLLASRTEAAA